MKFIRTGALCAIIIMMLSPLALAIPGPTDVFYVNDFANVLDGATERYIEASNVSLDTKTGAEVVVVTVEYLDGMDIEQYSYELFNDWGIGDKDKNNGVLLLLSTGELDYCVTLGMGLEGLIKTGRRGDASWEALDAGFVSGDYSTAVKAAFDDIIGSLSVIYGITVTPDYGNGYDYDYDYSYGGQDDYGLSGRGIFAIGVLVVIFVVIAVIVSIAGGVSRRRGYGGHYRPRGSGFFWGWVMGQTMRGRNSYRGYNRRGPPPPGGFGGFGGRGGGGFGGGSRGGGGGPSRGGGGGTRGGGFTRRK